ncbi:ESPR-type extended signal peptide-containing protein [Paraburkholderia phymatum]|uniref:YadA domain protein n=1 Tax=Paraburkholderia phymatum (strain DSM 17167 / CIP 108236 / LMG 21445 / STM815) TaxID=391038 RepID=B2JQB2_PARP8|nr:ESPR-type extended signal peptide-containing protein [Paraburkholderia phymatum]ACC73453.1 YadA domain protein [Paraburkholderia phymatum STM815]
MNKTYQSVWNEAAGTYIAAAENTRAHGKKSSRCALNIASAALASAVTFGTYGAAWAADPALTPKPTSSAANLATPAPASDFFCFLFWCGAGGNTTNITYNGVNAQDAYAYTYDRNNLKYFHVDSKLGESSASGGGGDAIAIGGAAKANGVSKDGSAYGWPGSTAGNGPIAIGGEALAQGAANLAVGIDATADGLYHAVAVGGNAQAADIYTVAVGGHALASAQTSTALGSHAAALANGSVALGESSVATRSNTVSVGKQGAERQIVNVAAGSAGTDAVNVNQLNAAIASAGGNGGGGGGAGNNVVLPADLKYFHATSTLADASAAGQETVAVGGNATALARGSVALGSRSVADRVNTVSVGNDQTNRQITHLAAGTMDNDAVNVAQLNTTVQNALTGGMLPNLVVYDSVPHDALTLGGVGAAHPVRLMNVAGGAITQTSTDAINGSQMFQLAQATQQGFNDVGSGMSALAQSTAAALGGDAGANTADGSITPPSYKIGGQTYHNVGQALDALAASGGGGSVNSVNYDTGAHNSVTLGGTLAHAPVALTNVANGAINASSTDAVNGKQLYATAGSVASAIGAGALLKSDGTLAAPAYVISGVTYNDMGSAINAIGAVGQDVQVTAKYVKVSSTASQALSNGVETTAIGGAAYASGDRSVAIGTGARAQYDDSVAIGSNAQVYESGTVSVGRKSGEKRVTNVANGVNATDAATVGQLNALQKSLSAQTQPALRSALLTDTSALDYIKVSPNVMAGTPTQVSNDLNAMAIGPSANASGANAVAVGAGSGAARAGSTAVGSRAAALALNSTVVGQSASTGFNAQNGVSIGYMADAEGVNSMGFGSFSIAGGAGSVAIGYNALVYNAASNAMAFGTGATVTAANSIALGGGSIADRANTISVGNMGTQRQVVNVAAGTANADAVNVSQLKGVTSALGGGASVAADGSLANPSYVLGGTTYNDVGAALTAAAGASSPDAVKYDSSAHNKVTLGGTGASAPVKLANVAAGSANTDAVNLKQLKDLGANIDASGAVTSGFVAYDDASNTNVSLKGAGGTRIRNVAAGSVSASSLDAVNGSQLFQTNQNVANVIAGLSNASNTLNNMSDGGGLKYFHANSSLADSQAGADSVAIGGNALATTSNAVALGSNSRVTADNTVAIGADALADRANSVSVGASGAERQIVNVAAGTQNTDAVNVKQLKDLGASFDINGNVSGAFVAYDDASKTRVTLGGAGAAATVKVTNVAAGSANTDAVNVKQLKDLGASFDTNGNATSAFVAYDDASSKGTATLKGVNGTKVTNLAAAALNAASKDAVNGSQLYQTNLNVANVSANVVNVSNMVNNIMLGGGIKYFHATSQLDDSSATGSDSIAIGGAAQAADENAIALGANARANASNAIALGGGSVADRVNTVSVGVGGAERQLVNLAAGTQSTDAVNVSQLKGVTSALGGGANVGSDGAVTKPAYVIGGTTYNDVGAAIDAAAHSGSDATDAVKYDTAAHSKVTLGGVSAASPVKLTNVAAGSANTDAVNVKQLKDLGASFDTGGNVTSAFVAYDDAQKRTVTLKGAGGTKITNLLAGALNANSTDAVNGSQLYQTNQDVANLSGSLNNVGDTLNNLNDGGGLKYFHASSALADSQATGANSVAIGGNAQAATDEAIAVGSNARSTASNAVALGTGSLADRANTVSVGAGGAERQIVNVAAGTQNTDAVNLRQLKDLGASFDNNGNVSSAFVAYDSASKNKVTFGGVGATTAVKLSNVAPGSANTDAVNVKQLKDLGASFDTSGNVTSAFVAYDDASTKATITLKGASGTKITNLLAGALNANSMDAVNGSQLYQTNQNVANVAGNVANLAGNVSNMSDTLNNLAGGGGLKYFHASSALADSQATGANSVAIGGNAQAATDEAIAVGSNARSTASNAVALGTGSLADRANTVSVGAGGAERQIVNVAAGTQNTDAVNLRQLKDLGASFDNNGNVSSAFVAYDSASKIKVTFGGVGATTAVKLSNVAPGSANTDAVNVKQLKDLGASFDTSGNVTSAFVAYDDASTKGTITLKGASGTKITNLLAGALNANSMDAVNGSQLYQTNQNVANVAGNVDNMSNTVNNIMLGGGIRYFHANSARDDSLASGEDAIAIGGDAQANDMGAVAIGAHAQAAHSGSIALGDNAQASASNSVALGANASTNAVLTTPAYQPGTTPLAGATPVGEVSVGSAGSERRVTNVAAGAAGTDAVNVSQLKSAVDASSSAVLASAVLYDEATRRDSVTLGGTTATSPVALRNVAPGSIGSTSRDAVNGSQLFNVANSTAAALGGGAAVGSDGKIGAPTYVIADKSYSDVGTALSAVDKSMINLTGYTKYIQVSVKNPNDDPVANAKGDFSVAIGSAAAAQANLSLALGTGSRASEEGAVAIGYGALARFANSVALGSGSHADEDGVVSVGSPMDNLTRRITNVADGINANDAVTVEQLNAMHDQLLHSSSAPRSMLLGAPNPLDYIAISTNVASGASAQTSTDLNAMAIGPGASASGTNALAVGAMSAAGASKSTAVGAGAAAARDGSTSIGQSAAALGIASTVIGTGASTAFGGTNSVSLGYMADAEGVGSLGFGAMSIANANGSIALGTNSLTTAAASNAVALGANSIASRANTISVGSDTLQRQIVNVAAGTSATDAVNVSQLKGVANLLGGGADLASDGSVKQPVYTISGRTYNDVGTALAAAAASGGGASPDAVSYDTAAHDRITLGGASASAPVKLTNVAPALLASGSTDAVNGGQLFNTASTVAGALGSGAIVGADGKIKAPAYAIGGSTYNSVGGALAAVDSALATGGNPNGLVYDSPARNTVTLGGAGAGTPVRLTNVADARLDSDAVNLKQLKAAGVAVDPSTGVVTNALVAYDGVSKSSVTFNAGNSPTQLKNVADAVDAFDAVNLRQMQSYMSTQITNFTPAVVVDDLPVGTATGQDAVAIGTGANASGNAAIAIGAHTSTAGDRSIAFGAGASALSANAVALGANSVADRDNSVSVGAAGAERQITNVAAGTAATDAVNVGQMNSAVSGVYKSMQDMDRENRRGIASASALNIVTPYLPGRTTLNAGVAGYRGTAALGVGVSRWNEKGTVNYNLGVSSAGGNSTIVRAGLGIVFGN